MMFAARKARRRPARMRRCFTAAAAAVLAANIGFPPVFSATAPPSPADGWSYADIADLFLAAPIVVRVRVAEAIPLKDAAAASRSLGTNRFYLSGDVMALIRGSGGLSPRIAWIADVPVDARGKVAKLKKAEVLLSALPVAGRPGEIRLAVRDGMVPWSAALESRVRGIVASGLDPAAPPLITGIANAFYSKGNLPGEGETQVFLTTATGQPVSLQVLRRPGQEPRFAVAFGEIVDEAAGVPPRDTLGWYRLACTLPPSLPGDATDTLSAPDAALARADYRFAIESLGACIRRRR